jgi:hypothetical protein
MSARDERWSQRRQELLTRGQSSSSQQAPAASSHGSTSTAGEALSSARAFDLNPGESRRVVRGVS